MPIYAYMNEAQRRRPVVLCILDGWGERDEQDNNAIALGRTPVMDRLSRSVPRSLLHTCGRDVGLPDGQMGNSEVGHMNLGAGRVVAQTLPRIDQAIDSGALRDNPTLRSFAENVKAGGGRVHIMGLLSPGGVHSHQNHIAALARILTDQGLPVAVHAFLDGRDTPPRQAAEDVQAFRTAVPAAPIVTVTGRYYAMDRDKRWDRVAAAYNLLVNGDGARAPDPIAAIKDSYSADVSDEFVAPTAIGDYDGMRDGDGLIMANFRADRVREILTALLDPDFDGFERGRRVLFAAATGMAEYSTELNRFLSTLFPPLDLRHSLGEQVAAAGLKQLRIAETEKYAHVTFFFNGGKEETFPGEERILVPSPKVATYDQQPEMSAPEVTDKLVAAIDGGTFDLIVCNYANGDMVGHSGDLQAAIKAVETVDGCMGRVVDAVTRAGGCMLVTADHGNCEQMLDKETGQPHTAHTTNDVPLLLVNGPAEVSSLAPGRLADIAPTLLALLGLPQPAEMTGRSLLRPAGAAEAAAE